MSYEFKDASKWELGYVRNNKGSGVKNLRCFPFHGPNGKHHPSGFCGDSAVVKIPNMKAGARRLFAWAEFRTVDNDAPSVLAGESITLSTARMLEVDGTMDENRIWYPSSIEPCDDGSGIEIRILTKHINFDRVYSSRKSGFELFCEQKRRVSTIREAGGGCRGFLAQQAKLEELWEKEPDQSKKVFNANAERSKVDWSSRKRNRGGWHYGWVSNKFVRRSKHTLTCLVFAEEPKGGGVLTCLAACDSPHFEVSSSKKGLPASVKSTIAPLPLEKPIILWATPRSLSTAFERSVYEISDQVRVLHETFADPCYFGKDAIKNLDAQTKAHLQLTGLSRDSTYASSLARLLENPCTFTKELSIYHQKSKIPNEEFRKFNHVFLMRNPEKIFSSYLKICDGKKGSPHFNVDEGGFKQLWEIYERAKEFQSQVVVLDADDLLENPEKMLRAWCERMKLTFSKKMLKWEPKMLDEWKKWPKWHDVCAESTGFRAPKNEQQQEVEFPPDVVEAIDECAEYYAKLREVRLVVAADDESNKRIRTE